MLRRPDEYARPRASVPLLLTRGRGYTAAPFLPIRQANKARERQRQLDEAQQRVADKREEFRAQREGKLAMADARDGEL